MEAPSAPGPLHNGQLLRTSDGQSIRIVGLLREGGMSFVYLARWVEAERDVCVKLPRPGLETRFCLRELPLSRRVRHPCVVETLGGGYVAVGDFQGPRELPFLVAAYAPGVNLADYVQGRRRRLPWKQTCAIIRRVAEGLDAIHAVNVVHRDIKPSNIVFDSGANTLQILDLGLARSLTPGELDCTQGSDQAVLLGTFDFLAPEQAQDPRRADARSDLYSLGCLWFFLLTGQPPFANSPTMMARLFSHANPLGRPTIRACRGDVPLGLDNLVRRLMSVEPADRPPSARELIAELDRRLEHSFAPEDKPLTTRRTWMRRSLAAGALLTTGTVAAWLARVSPEKSASSSSKTAPWRLAFRDGLATDVLDPERWIIGRPTVAVVEGAIVLRNRGCLVTRGTFPQGFKLSFRWMWQTINADTPQAAGTYQDDLAVVLHTRGQPRTTWSFEIPDGLMIKFFPYESSAEIYDRRTGQYPALCSNIPQPQWTWRRIQVVDFNNIVSVYLDDMQNPIMVGQIPRDWIYEDHHIAIYNREPVGGFNKVALLDDFEISVPSATDSIRS